MHTSSDPRSSVASDLSRLRRRVWLDASRVEVRALLLEQDQPSSCRWIRPSEMALVRRAFGSAHKLLLVTLDNRSRSLTALKPATVLLSV
jgi:hypothetical protein